MRFAGWGGALETYLFKRVVVQIFRFAAWLTYVVIPGLIPSEVMYVKPMGAFFSVFLKPLFSRAEITFRFSSAMLDRLGVSILKAGPDF